MATAVLALNTEPHIRRLQYVTLLWMMVECSVALTSAARAHSVSLLAFGSDSFVEVISATVVLLQFTRFANITPARAARVCGSLLYVLAVAVTVIAVAGLMLRNLADTSLPGMAITAGALILMPVLARKKRIAAEQTRDRALRADAVQSATCAYLAAITLAGQLLHRVLRWHWIDAVAALAAVPILIIEAKRARKGHTCTCC